ncbi:phosphate signaling complex protein PhoU [Diplocloster agilis]|uniref:phosphate signaling complex protein PhoU n=1 Tax=Diplocloster agilis TaxID=2850323 RepID=UPI000822B065|nr:MULTISPECIES: phosphate signaling complex protein PhoU [Lachnospiraceae]MBU9745997.1 phosphate signaling complex protein PhoU [Diplocloster agilis]MCU6735967.1 phosphate signaling complex protein PhoU [Suonthocola fibrivorans]SCJ84694.1 Phosphate transport system protein phoU homolog [uncultured Clostridium sp.]
MTTRVVYLEELKDLNNDVIKMGAFLENSIDDMVTALQNMDKDLAREIIEKDDFADDLERSIEQQCIHIVAKQQPVATDLRRITSFMRIISDLERIADHCSDISEYILSIAAGPDIPLPDHIEEMIMEMKHMVKQTIDSFIEEDEQKALEVVEHDDVVDEYFEKIKEELCTAMKHNPNQIRQYADFLMIIKYVERMADHSTNVAKWIGFIVTGDLDI